MRSPIYLLANLLLLGALLASCSSNKPDQQLVDFRKKLAGELHDNGLYQGAIDEYQALLNEPGLDHATRGNINYLIGRIYFNDLNDYKNAAAYFVRAKTFDPEGSYVNEASRQLIASLEKIGRVVDAKRQLDKAVDLDADQRPAGDVQVARIDDEPIWLSEVDNSIQKLPPQMQKQFVTPVAKRDYVHNYVGAELMYRAAKREGYGDDPEIIKKQDDMLRQLILEKYIVDKVMPEVKIDSLDVRNFYEANKNARYVGRPYDSVKADVFMDYQNEKAQAAFSDYLNQLASKENVRFFEENIR